MLKSRELKLSERKVEKVICPSKRIWFAMIALLAAMLALFVVSTGAQAQRFEGDFWISVGGLEESWNNALENGGGSGWWGTMNVVWYEYPQTTPLPNQFGFVERVPRFWNQWYYDGVLDLTRRKIVDISFDATPLVAGQTSFAAVYLNWSTNLYPLAGPNGPPPMTDLGPSGEQWIGRAEVGQILVPAQGIHISKLRYWLPINYNPEWVSVDVRGFNVSITNGALIHECVPEPSSILALLCGLGGACGLARRMKR